MQMQASLGLVGKLARALDSSEQLQTWRKADAAPGPELPMPSALCSEAFSYKQAKCTPA